MSVILIFIAFVIIGDAIAIGIASVVEQYSSHASLLVFLALFILVFCVAWVAALHVTERYILRVK